MRDLLVIALIFGTIPYVIKQPYIGILLWSWISYMNPHQLAWGWARTFPVAQIAAIATFIGILASKEKLIWPRGPLLAWWLVFLLFLTLTTVFAVYPADAWEHWQKVAKIQLVALLTVPLMATRERLHKLVWVIALSLAFFGAKGGLYVLRTGGGSGLVWGPPGGFISGNNELALALVMTLPLLFFLRRWASRVWVQRVMLVVIGLTVISILGSFSRGALLGTLASMAFLAWKSGRKLPVIAAALAGLLVAFFVLPQTWWSRMNTIESYEQDTSATQRLDAWRLGFNVANARPLGCGFDCYTEEMYLKYQPNFLKPQDSHSIYFEVLGEHGWLGLFLFLGLFVVAWLQANRTIASANFRSELQWECDLLRMVQVSVIGYAVGGAFLGLAYFDLPYHLVAIVIIVGGIVARTLAASPTSKA